MKERKKQLESQLVIERERHINAIKEQILAERLKAGRKFQGVTKVALKI